MSVAELLKENFATTTVSNLQKYTIESPTYAKSVIIAGVPQKVLKAILDETQLPKKLELIRLLHDIITNDIEELADKTVANDKLQKELATLIRNYETIPLNYIESLCNICFQRGEIGQELLEQLDEKFIVHSSLTDAEVSSTVSYLTVLATLVNGMSFQADLHLLLAEKVALPSSDANPDEEEIDFASLTFGEDDASSPIRRLSDALLGFWESGDFIDAAFLRHEHARAFLTVVLRAQALNVLAMSPTAKEWCRRPAPVRLCSFLHYLSVVDHTRVDGEEEVDEDEEDPRASVLTPEVFRALSAIVGRLTNLRTDLQDEAACGSAGLAALAWAVKLRPDGAWAEASLQLLERLCERVVCAGAEQLADVDAANAASAVRVIAHLLVPAAPAEDDWQDDEAEGKEGEEGEVVEEAWEVEARSAVVALLQRASRPVLRALGMLAPRLKDDSEGCVALCQALQAVHLIAEEKTELRPTLLEGGKGKPADRAALEKKVRTVKPATPEETAAKADALALFTF